MNNLRLTNVCGYLAMWVVVIIVHSPALSQTYKIIGTGVTSCYNNTITMACPTSSGDAFYGQFQGNNLPSYQNNGDGTITDLQTGLMWQSSPDANGDQDGTIEKTDKLTWTQIQARVLVLNSSNYAGHNDWRIPTIKELYSLTNWNGTDPSGLSGSSTTGLIPFLDTTYFPFAWGSIPSGERIIDVQYASCNIYNELSFSGYHQLFGYNFADGRIKGYDVTMPGGSDKVFSFIAVRGNTAYGINHFHDNGDQTITDSATGLTWMKDDSHVGMDWQAALGWAQTKNAADYCGHNDWRLPNAKELQSIVDYTRSPGSTNSAAIDPLFDCTSITNEAGYTDWPWFWTSTTHRSYNGTAYGGVNAIYVCFGRAPGWIKKPGNTYYSYCDVHGAGAQRSDPKSGTYVGDYFGVDSLGHAVYGRGPQGDILRINNFVRLVRGGTTQPDTGSVSGSVRQGWNMVSLSRLVTDSRRSTVYPTAISSAFKYDSGYVTCDTLQIGVGYWLKFASAQNIDCSGDSVSVDSIDVHAGWNLIGSISAPAPVSSIGILTQGLAVSGFFGYEGSYEATDTIQPGKGYWVKANREGRIRVSAGDIQLK